MNKAQFYTYLDKPELLDKSTILEFEEILREYPWFQTAHILYLKSLFNSGHLKFNKQLRKSSTLVSDRKVLYSFLNSQIPDYNLQVETSDFVTEKQKKNHKKIIRKPNESKSVKVDKKSEKKKVKNLEKSSEVKEDKKVSKRDAKKIIKTKLKKVSNKNDDDLNMNHSFDEWLKLFSNKKTAQRNQDKIEEEKDNSKEIELIEKFIEPPQNELIDKFIELNPRLESPIEFKSELKDVSITSVSDDDSFITETLAKIYIKQKHYERAIQAYQKLSLKYPEKNIYFANQIEKIKKLNNE